MALLRRVVIFCCSICLLAGLLAAPAPADGPSVEEIRWFFDTGG